MFRLKKGKMESCREPQWHRFDSDVVYIRKMTGTGKIQHVFFFDVKMVIA